MLPSTTLEKSFCADLIRHKAFNGAETLVRDTYKLQVEAKQSEKKFVITAVNIDILELAEELLKSWLERKKKGKGDSIDDKIKDTKDNYLLDISEGHVIWIFWGELGSKLLSEDWKKETEKLKFIGSASVSIKPMPKKKTCITCSFEYFEAVRKKVENLIQLVTSGISSLSSLDKSQRSESNDGSKGKDQTGTDGSKGKDQTGIDGSKGKDQTGTDGSKGKDQTGTDGSKGKDQTGTVSSNGKYLDGVGGSNGKDQTVSENSLKSDNNGSKGSGQTHSDKLKVTTSRDTGQTDPGTSGSEDKGSRGTKKQEMIAADHKGTSQWNMDQSKSETPTIEAEDSDADTASQSEGESRENKLPPLLRGKENGSTQMPLGSASKHEISEKDKYQLFCTENGKIKVYVYEASIVSLSGVDAIVNAANERLNHIGGVAYHISKASGGDKSALEIECHNFIEKNKKVRVTKNFTSSAGNMPYVGVIHAVGPMWSDYKAKDDCAKDLCMTIVNVLMEADKKKFLKIAVPAISSGIYGIPKRLCAEMYIRGVVDYDRQNPQTCVREIHFVDIAKDILKEIRDAYERWKQNDNNINFKNANSYRSESDSELGKTAYSKGSMRGNPAASWKSTSKMSVFHLSEKTCVKLYTCSIVDVKDVDAVACAIDTDFSTKKRAVARAIRRAGGTRYEEEFSRMVSNVSPNSRKDVFICEAGNLCRSNNIAYVIHIKVPKDFKMDLLRHHYIQVFETARKWIMEKIAMPLIGAANLVNTSEDDKYECSCLFVNTLKEVIESRGEDMTVKEIHLVDLDEKIISLLCRAFQDTMDSNINQTVRAAGRKPSSTPKSEDAPRENQVKIKKAPGDHEKGSDFAEGTEDASKENQVKKQIASGDHEKGSDFVEGTYRKGNEEKSDDQRNVENLSGTCSFDNCKRKVERKCKNCLKVVCKLCIMDDETQCPFCKKNFNLEEKKAVEKQGETVIPSDEVDNCPICMETLTSPKILPCGHKFHAECIDQSLKYKKTCPICGQVVGQLTGYQPPGKMNNQIREDITPPGFEKCGTIEISYDFPDGVQGEDHPHPGMSYRGTRRRAYLPNNTEGQKVLKLLQVAFDRKLIFTIGESRTTGKKNIVTWNDIHHKTRIDGGPTNFGYPDETYLKRVQEELADKGVTEKDIRVEPVLKDHPFC